MSEQDAEHHHDPIHSWPGSGVKRCREGGEAYSFASILSSVIYEAVCPPRRPNIFFNRISGYLTMERQAALPVCGHTIIGLQNENLRVEREGRSNCTRGRCQPECSATHMTDRAAEANLVLSRGHHHSYYIITINAGAKSMTELPVIGVPSLDKQRLGASIPMVDSLPFLRRNGVNFHDASSGRSLILFDGRLPKSYLSKSEAGQPSRMIPTSPRQTCWSAMPIVTLLYIALVQLNDVRMIKDSDDLVVIHILDYSTSAWIHCKVLNSIY